MFGNFTKSTRKPTLYRRTYFIDTLHSVQITSTEILEVAHEGIVLVS